MKAINILTVGSVILLSSCGSSPSSIADAAKNEAVNTDKNKSTEANNKKLNTKLPSVDPSSAAGLLPSQAEAPVKVEKGMTADEVKSALGKSNYQYALAGEEVWVYENKSYLRGVVTSTAVNMVPVVGPASSLLGNLSPKTQAAKSVVTFDAEGKVKFLTEAAIAPTS